MTATAQQGGSEGFWQGWCQHLLDPGSVLVLLGNSFKKCLSHIGLSHPTLRGSMQLQFVPTHQLHINHMPYKRHQNILLFPFHHTEGDKQETCCLNSIIYLFGGKGIPTMDSLSNRAKISSSSFHSPCLRINKKTL